MSTATVHKLGPGQLTFGEAGSATEFGLAIKSATLVPEVEDGETITVLSGATVEDDTEISWTLEGSLYQSYAADSLIKWCNDNSGQLLGFVYKARNDQPLQSQGKVTIRPISYGGDVKERNTSDFTFKATEVTFTAPAGG